MASRDDQFVLLALQCYVQAAFRRKAGSESQQEVVLSPNNQQRSPNTRFRFETLQVGGVLLNFHAFHASNFFAPTQYAIWVIANRCISFAPCITSQVLVPEEVCGAATGSPSGVLP